jgi:hypothetical protein
VLAIAIVAIGIVLLRPGGGDDKPGRSPAGSQGNGAATGNVPTRKAPATGPPLSLTTPEGYTYRLAAVKAGVDGHPLSASTPAPEGRSYAYADYILTNTSQRAILLDFPPDLFVKKALVSASERQRCMPQPGVPDDMCTLPTHNQVIAYVDTAKPPITQDGDTFMPGGASYMIRIATDLPVTPNPQTGDIRPFVFNPRFTSDRKGVEVVLP